MRPPLTAGQKRVLDFIGRYIRASGLAPTQKEIRDHFGWSSLGTVSKHLGHLERGGYIRRARQQPRGISIVDETESRLFVAEDLPDARELLERVVRNLPEVLSLPASGRRIKSAMRVFGLGSTYAARLLRALDHDPAQNVGCSEWEAAEDLAGDQMDGEWWRVVFGCEPPPDSERRRRYAHQAGVVS